jgi:site-specific recombinase XerD
LSNDAHEILVQYLKARPSSRAKRVFLIEKGRFRGKPINVRGIQHRMQNYAQIAGLKASCHRLHHTMATQLLNAEAEVETIHDLLGLNWITTTQLYCKVSNLKVQRDYFKAMRNVLQRSGHSSSSTIFDIG